jgi:predicted nucleotidyltransferase
MVLTPHQEKVAERVLAEESARRKHVVVALSGAHAYGFPSPDSDLDLKGIHVEPTRTRLGLAPKDGPAERVEVIDGVEIDYSANELGGVVAGILKGNGNYVERVLGPHLLVRSPWLDELAPLVTKNLSRRVHRHYRGFAQNQLGFAEQKPTAKRVLYVLRTASTGIHLLRTGEVVTDLTQLAAPYGFDIAELIDFKLRGEKTALTAASLDRARGAMERAFALLDDALAVSVLPEDPVAADEIEDWLIDLRVRLL